MNETKKANRLIIIGNGFDLAHGYKTSYKDFLFHIIFKRLLEFKQTMELGTYSSYKLPEHIHFRTDLLSPTDFQKFSNQINSFQEQIKKNDVDLFGQLKNFIKNSGFSIVFPSQLISQIYNDTNLNNWVDVEEAYYSLIKSVIYHKSDLKPNYSELELIRSLNKSLLFLTSELEQYLSDIIFEKFSVQSMVMKFINKDYGTTYVLNFNYTTTFTQYFEINTNYEIINIHGELNNKDNPIIFGLGDENHSIYPQIVESNIDEMLHNVKSLKYLETNNYEALKLAIDKAVFDVDIIGHSCGISDRTLLKEVFTHSNCLKVNIHHHNGLASYRQSVYGVSRYFENNFDMRQKIKPFNSELNIPQIKSVTKQNELEIA